MLFYIPKKAGIAYPNNLSHNKPLAPSSRWILVSHWLQGLISGMLRAFHEH